MTVSLTPRRRWTRPRVIPVLLLRNGQLCKTVRFRHPKYVGDPRVAVKIFNDKGCDELILLDITATPGRRKPDFSLIEEIVTESFMPVAYGGGISTAADARAIFSLGVEKAVLNTHAVDTPSLVQEISAMAGASSTVVSIDVGRDWLRRRRVVAAGGRRWTALDPRDWARRVVELGAGEIVLNSIDRDGSMEGYDLDLIADIAHAVDVPVVAVGGAGHERHFREAVEAGAAAAAAGSIFVFQGSHRAVLITYPDESKLSALFD
jgi:cyclase